MKENCINVVVGSWGSYNACNKRALGSEWLCLNEFESWEEIEKELENQGFKLNGIDEELFIQDIEGVDCGNCDYMHPKRLFETLKESGVLFDEYAYNKMVAYIEVNSWDDFENLVESRGDYWDDDIYFYEGQNMVDVAYQLVEDCGYLDQMSDHLRSYFDYEAFARDLSFDGFYETSNGVIEIR